VDNTFTFGGAINALAHLTAALDRSRFEPVILSAQAPEVLERLFPDTEIRHWRVKLMWIHDPVHRRVSRLPGFSRGPFAWVWRKARALAWLALVDAPAALRLAWLARRARIDLVHLNNGVEGMLPGLLAARLLGLPVVAHSRGPQSTEGATRFYAGIPDRWIAVSRTMEANLTAAGVPPERITVIHDAIDLAGFVGDRPTAGLRSQLGIPAGAPVFGVFGRIIPWKGIQEFVRAAVRVVAAVPEARALVGGDPSDGAEEYYREVRALAEELQLTERIHFTGFREDVADLMHMCDVVVHTSIVPEPFGMTVIEGMATGTAVVAAAAGGPTEIIDPGRTGVLVDPRDAEALAGEIVTLLKDPEEAAAMGSRGASRAREHYSAHRYAREVQAVYERVVSSS
jgi:glycosyltransferase involved in cell wall biosynthesis